MKQLYDNKNIVKEVKKLDKLALFERCGVISLLGIEALLFIAKVIGLIKNSFLNCFAFFNWYIVWNDIGTGNIRKRNDRYLEKLEKDIEAITEEKCEIDSIYDIEMIRKNIQVGEDLSAKNIVPIFKDGYYLVIHSRPKKICLRQYKDDNKQYLVDILEDEDINDGFFEKLSEVDDKRKRLLLK